MHMLSKISTYSTFHRMKRMHDHALDQVLFEAGAEHGRPSLPIEAH